MAHLHTAPRKLNLRGTQRHFSASVPRNHEDRDVVQLSVPIRISAPVSLLTNRRKTAAVSTAAEAFAKRTRRPGAGVKQPQPKYLSTFEEYLGLERTAEFRSEYHAGEIDAIAGATDVHSRLSARSIVVLDRHLSRCQIYDGNLKTYIEARNEAVYPDAMVICDEPQLWNNQSDVIVNPTLVVEVLLPSTQRHDRGSKADSYRTIPDLQHILVISQERVFVEHHARQSEKNWLITEYSGSEDTIELLGTALKLQELYTGILR
jgi:Uma2 family endonuclease